MISTEQEARAAVAKVGWDAVAVVNLVYAPLGFREWCPGAIRFASLVYEAHGKPRKSSRLHRIATKWAAARGAAK